MSLKFIWNTKVLIPVSEPVLHFCLKDLYSILSDSSYMFDIFCVETTSLAKMIANSEVETL